MLKYIIQSRKTAHLRWYQSDYVLIPLRKYADVFIVNCANALTSLLWTTQMRWQIVMSPRKCEDIPFRYPKTIETFFYPRPLLQKHRYSSINRILFVWICLLLCLKIWIRKLTTPCLSRQWIWWVDFFYIIREVIYGGVSASNGKLKVKRFQIKYLERFENKFW